MDYHDDVEADWAVSFRHATQDFLDVIEDSRPAVLSARDAREVLRVALAAGQSAQTGTPVDITPSSWQGITT
jgi:predicted dehydrogenase